MKIYVLGGGLVGSTIARDLAKKHKVTVLDKMPFLKHIINPSPAYMDRFPFDTEQVDCSYTFASRLTDADLVVNALPGFLGYHALQEIIAAKKNCVDISFFEEDPFTLHQLALEAGISVVVDAGVAPGLCNMILGYHTTQFHQILNYECVVGGLPFVRKLPFQYKAPYSPADVIEFYMRPARIRVNGKIKTVDALSDLLNEDTRAGTLESFNTDGLRTLLTTMTTIPDVPNMRERTYRYPGTADTINLLKNIGFFSKELLKSGVPFQITSELLTKAWKLNPDEQEFTLMHVNIDGVKHGKPSTVQYELYDSHDGMDSSMARSTGFTCNAVVEAMIEGRITRKGIVAPEQFAMIPNNFQGVLDYLGERNVLIKSTQSDSSWWTEQKV